MIEATSRHALRISALAFAVALVTGCGGRSGAPAPVVPLAGGGDVASTSLQGTPDAKHKTVYVASRNSGQILGYPATANGNVAPTVTIAGAKTLLSDPICLALDASGKIYSANDSGSEVLIFPKGANGNVVPQVLGGSNVPLQATEGIAIDATGKIYVSDFAQNAIFVFAAGAHGNVKPIRTIVGAKTGFSQPNGMAFDSSGHLYVANYRNGSEPIEEFASGADGNVAPIATLGGSRTGLGDGEFNVSVDARDRIIIGNYGSNEVLIFKAGAHGNAKPALTISGAATMLDSVVTTGLDSSGRIYVSNYGPNSGSIVVFAASAHGNATPLNVITGSNTGMDGPYYPSVH